MNRILGCEHYHSSFSRSTHASATDMNIYPLHLKMVKKINWEAADECILPQFRELWTWGKYVLTERNFDLPPLEPSKIREANLTAVDVSRALQFGVIEKFAGIARSTVNVFSVLEIEKFRRRMIIEPTLNRLMLYPGTVRYPSFEELTAISIIEMPFHACIDFAAFYNSFVLPETMRDLYVFRHEGELYCLKVIATGQRQCPAVAHALTSSIALRCMDPSASSNSSTLIDNIRFSATSEELVSCAVGKLLRLTEKIGITVNAAEDIAIRSDYEFLGISFRHETTSISISEKTRNKLRQHLDLWTHNAPNFTNRDVLKTFGLIVWSSKVLGVPLAGSYYLLKFLRRRGKCALQDNACVWPSLLPNVRQILVHLIFNIPRKIQRANPDPWIVFCDASMSGYGIVIFDPVGNCRIVSGYWSNEEIISVLEIRVVKLALRLLQKQSAPTRLIILCDNTTAVGAIESGWSRNYWLNANVLEIYQLAKEKNYTICIHWLSTIFNIADAPSRLLEFMEAANTAISQSGSTEGSNTLLHTTRDVFYNTQNNTAGSHTSLPLLLDVSCRASDILRTDH